MAAVQGNEPRIDVETDGQQDAHQDVQRASPDMRKDEADKMSAEFRPVALNSFGESDEDEIVEEEPELHARTWLAIGALFALNFVQVFALTGTPAILAYIAKATDGASQQNWVPNATALIQAVLGPLYAFASDTYQARKIWLLVPCTFATVGAAICANMTSIYGVIAGQILIGFGFATVPLAYCIPSEILPRRWRPMAQALMNIAASSAAVGGPLIAGALTKRSPANGWRHYFYCQMAIWAATTLLILFGYKPPKRHTRLDGLTFWQKIGRLDIPGMLLLTLGLTVLLAGLSLGDAPWAWTNARVVTTLVIGCVGLVAFGIYEWKFNAVGILHHDLFRSGRTFAICVALIFVEGIQLFPIILFYPALTTALYEQDPFLVSLRGTPFWICAGISTIFYGYWSSKFRAIRKPLAFGFALYTAGLVGLACSQPGQSTRAIIFNGLSGLGFGSPLVLIIAGVQLSTPHTLIATSTAVVTSARAIAASSFTAIYGATLNKSIAEKLPSYIASAAAEAGLPSSSIPDFVAAMAGGMPDALSGIPGVTPAIIAAGGSAAERALADSFRLIYIIAVPFGVVAVILCFLLPNLSATMHYKIDAPMEMFHPKQKEPRHQA